ncbi:MAG: DUF3891 family protein [Acidobacteria bacterium]|nr:DUF3891 family protein [Acidobacteriota bacterium]MYJ04483.1 DUF3891 family protein [Acidobacteriota bacterium]
MTARPSPLSWRSSYRLCSSTSCVLQYGHQSAERLNTSISPPGPINDRRSRAAPFWSTSEKDGTTSPTCGPNWSTSGNACAAAVEAIANPSSNVNVSMRASFIMNSPLVRLPSGDQRAPVRCPSYAAMLNDVIVRPDGDCLLLVTQPDHAALSGCIMTAWRGDDLPASPRRETVLLATREHDNGWREVDAYPDLDPGSRRPHHFMTAPDATKQGIWPRGVRRIEPEDPDAAALVAQHALALLEVHPLPGWERFRSAMTVERDRLLRAGAYDNDLDGLLADYRFVFLGDVISLVFCCEWSETYRYAGYTVTRDGTTVQVQPDPFEGRPVELAVPARQLPARSFASNDDLHAAYDAAPRIVLRGTACGIESRDPMPGC